MQLAITIAKKFTIYNGYSYMLNTRTFKNILENVLSQKVNTRELLITRYMNSHLDNYTYSN